MIAIAKAAPGGLDWASSGNGTVQHLSLELFRLHAGVKLNHIPYRGGGPALNDLIAGQVKFFFANGAAAIGHVQGGAIKAIAHTGSGRLGTLPDLPPVPIRSPGFEAYEWNGVFVPTGTPAPIIAKLNAGLNAVLRQRDVIDRLTRSMSSSARTRRRSSAASWRPRWRSGAGSCARRISSSGDRDIPDGHPVNALRKAHGAAAHVMAAGR